MAFIHPQLPQAALFAQPSHLPFFSHPDINNPNPPIFTKLSQSSSKVLLPYPQANYQSVPLQNQIHPMVLNQEESSPYRQSPIDFAGPQSYPSPGLFPSPSKHSRKTSFYPPILPQNTTSHTHSLSNRFLFPQTQNPIEEDHLFANQNLNLEKKASLQRQKTLPPQPSSIYFSPSLKPKDAFSPLKPNGERPQGGMFQYATELVEKLENGSLSPLSKNVRLVSKKRERLINTIEEIPDSFKLGERNFTENDADLSPAPQQQRIVRHKQKLSLIPRAKPDLIQIEETIQGSEERSSKRHEFLQPLRTLKTPYKLKESQNLKPQKNQDYENYQYISQAAHSKAYTIEKKFKRNEMPLIINQAKDFNKNIETEGSPEIKYIHSEEDQRIPQKGSQKVGRLKAMSLKIQSEKIQEEEPINAEPRKILKSIAKSIVPVEEIVKTQIMKSIASREKKEIQRKNPENMDQSPNKISFVRSSKLRAETEPDQLSKEQYETETAKEKVAMTLKKIRKKRKTTTDKKYQNDLSIALERGLEPTDFNTDSNIILHNDSQDFQNKKLADLLEALDFISPVSSFYIKASNASKSKKG